MSFYLNFSSPTLKKDLKLKELPFFAFKTLNKFLTNKNNRHISDYFDEIVLSSLVEKDEYTKLTNFDKFCILFILRCTCISPDLEFNQNGANRQKSLLPLLTACLDFTTTFENTFEHDNIKFTVSLPTSLYFETLYEAFCSAITKLFINNKEIELIKDKKTEIIESLPAHITNEIKKFSETIETSFNTLNFKLVDIPSSTPFILSPFNLSFFELLKLLYTSDLKSIFDLHYILVSKLNYTPEYTDRNTLVENLLICKTYETELQAQKEAQQQMDKKNNQPK